MYAVMMSIRPTWAQLIDKEKRLWGWHISEYKWYDKPKSLEDFGLSRPPQSWCYVKEFEK